MEISTKDHAINRAIELLDQVSSSQCGTTEVVGTFFIETHTLGCREASDTPADQWWDEHWRIYDEYSNDRISTVIGDPSDGKFATVTPLSSSLA